MKKNISSPRKIFRKAFSLTSFFIAALLLPSCTKDDDFLPATNTNTGTLNENSFLSGKTDPNDKVGQNKAEFIVNESESPDAPYMPANAMIYIRHGMCAGSCPAYSVTLTHEGEVIYNGYRNVGTLGLIKYTVDQKLAGSLAYDMQQTGFLQFEDLYPVMKDAPETITGFNNGRSDPKIIVDYGFGVPEQLIELRKNIETQLGINKFLNATPQPVELPSPVPDRD